VLEKTPTKGQSPKTRSLYNNMSVQLSTKYTLPGKIRDEFRRTGGLKSYSFVCTQTQMKVKKQESLMFDMYHGTDKCVSQIDQILNGQPPFADLFNQTVKVITDPSSGSTSANVYVLKPIFARSEIPYRTGQEITRSVLQCTSFNGSELVTGRTLLSTAKSALRTIRKAVAICKEYVDNSGNPLYSGWSKDDVIEKVLDRMYEVLRGKTRTEDVKPDDQDVVYTNCPSFKICCKVFFL
jgi:hypothetical protein